METILILATIILGIFILKARMDKVNQSIEELRKELQKKIGLEKDRIKPSERSTKPEEYPDIVDRKKETISDFPPIPEIKPEVGLYELPGDMPPSPPPLPETLQPVPQLHPQPVYKEKKRINYEKYIGENLFGKIGILVLVAGVGFFVKYAIDKNWINEIMRTVLGFTIGIVLFILAERLKKKYRTFSSLLAGGSFAIFYVTVAIAYHYYQLFSQPVAFGVLILITILMSVLSVLYNHRELAIIALIGGFIAPFLVTTGEGNYKVLFTYIMILNVGMFFLSLFKKWAELPVISFLFTTIIMGLFIINNDIGSYAVGQASGALPAHLFLFSTAFYFIFLLPLIHILKDESPRINQILLILIGINNFVYLGFGLLFIRNIELSFKPDGLLSLFIAVINVIILFWLRKQKLQYNLLINTMLGMALVFATLAIPLQLKGEMITLFWAAEMVLVAWLYIKSKIRLYEFTTFALIIVTALSFFIDVFEYLDLSQPSVSYLVTHLFIGVSSGMLAFLISRYRTIFDKGILLQYHPWNTLLIVSTVFIFYYVFAREIYYQLSGWDRIWKAEILFTTGYWLLLVVVLQKRFPILKNMVFYILAILAGTSLFAIDSYLIETKPHDEIGKIIMSWSTAIVIILIFVETGRQYYRSVNVRTAQTGFTVYFTVMATLCWLILENLFLNQAGLYYDKSAGFSVALSLAGFIQMALGMRLHIKILRKLSLIVLSLVLVKLLVIDLWAMPTVGKIIVFIFLGITLLLLSFLYQKLKNVLFGEEEDSYKKE